jgi:3-hydroxyisobutyrate dehydrogenase-like beta-hydroxyacid dehydrogenase
MTNAPRIGFIGLGFMGHGMAANILKRGFPLSVMAHRKREAVEDLVRRGAKEVASSAEMAGESDIVILCVTGAKEVEEVVSGRAGLRAGARSGLIVIDCTTSDPQTLLRLAKESPEMTFVDAPLGRSPREAWEGALSAMVGCDAPTLERIRPVLCAFATTIQHAGALGDGHRLKLVNNFVSLGYASLYAEALGLALKAGLTVEAFDGLIRSSRMHCAFYDTFIGWAKDGDKDSHPFALRTALSTVADILSFSDAIGFKGELAAAVRNVYAQAVALGDGDAMLPELPRAIFKANAVDFAPPDGSVP